MSGDFIDSNVFIYMLDTVDDRKREIATQLVDAARREGTGIISFQVVQEVLSIATRRLQPSMAPSDTQELLETVLVPLWRVMPTSLLYERALGLHHRYRFSFFDSIILASALLSGCTRLLTEDLQHGQMIEGLRIENPFLVSSS
jgi:predicted nucleic acid-binding protein